MTRSSRDFLVYACTECGKRVFTSRDYLGRRGKCPLCGAKHLIGGPRTAEAGVERRKTQRVSPPDSQVELKRHRSQAMHKEDVLSQELFALADLSETGVAFMLPGQRDPRSLSGLSSPLKIGDLVQVTMHLPGVPRVLQAEVRRIVPPAKGQAGKPMFRVGVHFRGLTSAQRSELSELVARLEEDV